MTPDVRAAAQRLGDFVRGWTGKTADELPLLSVQLGPKQWVHLTLGDVRLVVSALDPAEQPSGVITPAGRAAVNAYRTHRTQQHPPAQE